MKKREKRVICMSTLIDITGKRFGRLTAIKREANSKGGQARWLCRCDCGNETIVLGTELRRSGARKGTKSCGCFAVEQSRVNGLTFKHNQSHSRQYHITDLSTKSTKNCAFVLRAKRIRKKPSKS
jgi:hypothetical protein